ncbi:hypothetical protein BC834DRAFT_850708 [Gloeopeniophorella convolvens]|nr:hypothetical protein BC834DRAFT_850708 [Gloeopeniophorella convolvens]
MSKSNISLALVRDISDRARVLRILANKHTPALTSEPSSVIHLRLPDVRAPIQYLMHMGLRPPSAHLLSEVYMEIVSSHRQAFEAHFGRTIRGGCHLPLDYYRKVFVVLFERAIQDLGSRMVSAARSWLCRSGLFRIASPLGIQRINVRLDGVTKAKLTSRIQPGTASPTLTETRTRSKSRIVDSGVGGYKEGGSLPLEPVKLSFTPPPSSTAPAPVLHDLFSQDISPTCFPARYPSPHTNAHSFPARVLASTHSHIAFKATPELPTSSTPDVPSLGALFSKMAINKTHQGLKSAQSLKPRSPKHTPPFTSFAIAGLSNPNLSRNPSSTLRRRKIAALPIRRPKTVCSSPSSTLPLTSGRLPFTDSPYNNITAPQPPIMPMQPICDIANASAAVSTRRTTKLTIQTTSDVVAPHSRKPLNRLRRQISASRVAPSSGQRTLPTTPLTWSIPYSFSRPPSLVSDTSSCTESPESSSDELDTPPTTPPSPCYPLPLRREVTGETKPSIELGSVDASGILASGCRKPPNLDRPSEASIEFTD